MTDTTPVARPYARAIFELARDHNHLPQWSAQLDLLSVIASDPDLIALATHPAVPLERVQSVVLEVAAPHLTPEAINLVKLLTHHRRLPVLPAIARIYAALRAAAEHRTTALMTTATEVDSRQREQFETALQQALDRRVDLTFAVDPTLIGGAVLRAGDWVVDGSVRAQLTQLATALRAG